MRSLNRTHRTSRFFGVHDFIGGIPTRSSSPGRTIASKDDSAAIKNTALAFARSLFVPKTAAYPSLAYPGKPDFVQLYIDPCTP